MLYKGRWYRDRLSSSDSSDIEDERWEPDIFTTEWQPTRVGCMAVIYCYAPRRRHQPHLSRHWPKLSAVTKRTSSASEDVCCGSYHFICSGRQNKVEMYRTLLILYGSWKPVLRTKGFVTTISIQWQFVGLWCPNKISVYSSKSCKSIWWLLTMIHMLNCSH